MAADFGSARRWAQVLMAEALHDGARAVDATMGNGHDTLWLCERVGETGFVWAFDIQQAALDRTRERLEEAGLSSRAALILEGHHHMARFVPEPVDGVMFNLGWLPGTDKARRTRADTTIPAADAALSLLKPAGLLTICVYPGHEEGAIELQALVAWAGALDPRAYDAMTRAYVNQPNDPPVLFAVRKRP